jgi:hypothetical protein
LVPSYESENLGHRLHRYLNAKNGLWKSLFLAYGGPYLVAVFLKITQVRHHSEFGSHRSISLPGFPSDPSASTPPLVFVVHLALPELFERQPHGRLSDRRIMFVASVTQTILLSQVRLGLYAPQICSLVPSTFNAHLKQG